jgi:sulfatase maturation enzyme AslB (radical SAM superfamily)
MPGTLLGRACAKGNHLGSRRGRPKHLIEHEDCLSCRYLSICHGGCPMRTYSALGTMLAKYPYCEVYKAVFGRAESHGRKILHSRLGRKINLLTH